MSVAAAPAPTAAPAVAVAIHSAVYHGRVEHRRQRPVAHRFGLRLYCLYLDLDELDRLQATGGPLAARWWRPLRFRRADYLGPAGRPLVEAVRDEVARHCGRRPTGPVRMLTHLRTWGYVFNPVTFYYCFEPDGALFGVLAEITNTPWGERHAYFLPAPKAHKRGRALHWEFDKQFHVSPFIAMQRRYHWALSTPGDSLHVHMDVRHGGQHEFDATLALERREWNAATLSSSLARYPWLTAQVAAGIYWQAARLWLKRTPFHVHPAKVAHSDGEAHEQSR